VSYTTRGCRRESKLGGIGRYAYFSVEFLPTPLPRNDKVISIDLGLESFATLSNGKPIQNHHYYRRGNFGEPNAE
jgi:transposase